MRNVHMVYDNETWDYSLEELNLGIDPNNDQVLNALSEQAGIPRVKLNGFVVNKSDTGDITVSPRAIFGRYIYNI